MNETVTENEWVLAREDAIEAMWATPLPQTDVEITEDDLPF